MDVLRSVDEILPSSSYCFCHQLWNPRSVSGHLSGNRGMSSRQVVTELMTPPAGDIPQGPFLCALTLITSQDFQTRQMNRWFLLPLTLHLPFQGSDSFTTEPFLAWSIPCFSLEIMPWIVMVQKKCCSYLLGCSALTLCSAESTPLAPLAIVDFRIELGCDRMGIMHWETCKCIHWIKKKINFKSISPLSFQTSSNAKGTFLVIILE